MWQQLMLKFLIKLLSLPYFSLKHDDFWNKWTCNNHIGQSRDGPRPRRPNQYLQTFVLFDIIVLTDDNDIHKIIIIHFSQFIWLWVIWLWHTAYNKANKGEYFHIFSLKIRYFKIFIGKSCPFRFWDCHIRQHKTWIFNSWTRI